MALIECKDLCCAYDGKEVVHNVSFQVNEGDYLCVVGGNGSGKSTLMKTLLGLKKPSSGEIIFGDGLKQNCIGYLPQQTVIQKDFPASVYEVVLSGRLNKLGCNPFYSKNDKEIALSNMKLLDIEDIKNKCYKELSGGQQQRVLLARALCSSSKLLLLDEPVAGLDPVVTSKMYDLIDRLNQDQKITIIMVSHDIIAATTRANRILHINHKVVFDGTVNDYMNNQIGKDFIKNSTINN